MALEGDRGTVAEARRTEACCPAADQEGGVINADGLVLSGETVVASDLEIIGSDRSMVAGDGGPGGTSAESDRLDGPQEEFTSNSEVPATVESPTRLSIVD